jgi:hypothetical protein
MIAIMFILSLEVVTGQGVLNSLRLWGVSSLKGINAATSLLDQRSSSRRMLFFSISTFAFSALRWLFLLSSALCVASQCGASSSPYSFKAAEGPPLATCGHGYSGVAPRNGWAGYLKRQLEA